MQQKAVLPGSEEEEILRGCSTYTQYHQTRNRIAHGKCSFCPVDKKLNEILFEQQGWILWQVPHTFTTRGSTLGLQIVFAPVRHLRHMCELNDQERLGYFGAIDWIHKTYTVPGGAFITRVGDMRFNVGTVPHLHTSLFVPNRTGEVLVPLQKSSDWHNKDTERMYDFARRYEAGERP